MTPVIDDLIERFERGQLSRRELVAGLSALFAFRTAAAQQAAPDQSLTPTGIDHVSVLASDAQRSADFYSKLFGLSVLSEDKEHGILRLGRDRHIIVSIRKEKPYGTVDHFGVKLAKFDRAAVNAVLEKQGLTPKQNWQYGFYVDDPDGVHVQLL